MTQTTVKNSLTKQKDTMVQIHENLTRMIEAKSKALPKDFNQTRFIQNCMTVLVDTKGIEKMKPLSVARTMLKGAVLGLDFFRKECYAIPYGDELNFQTDYKGDKKIAKKHSIRPIKEIFAKLVREGDLYEVGIHNGEPQIIFKSKPFSSGKIIGAFAVVLYTDGGIEYEDMSTEDIENIRSKFSKAPNSKAWVETTGEMYKKTVLRRLCKNIEIDFDQDTEERDQFNAYNEGGGVDFDTKDATIIDVTPEPTVEPEAGENPFNQEA